MLDKDATKTTFFLVVKVLICKIQIFPNSRANFIGIQPPQSYKPCMFEIQCFAVFVLKFTGILSLNLCFISEVQWEPRLTSNLASTPFPSINSEVAAMQSWVPGHVCTYPMSIFTLEGASTSDSKKNNNKE